MKLKNLFIAALLFIIQTSYAQDKLFTIEDVVFNSYSTLAPERLNQIGWIPDSDNYCFVESENDESILVMSSADENDNTEIISLSKLNEYVTKAGLNELKNFPRFSWNSQSVINFWVEYNLCVFDIENENFSIMNTVKDQSQNKEIAPNNIYAAYTIDNNLYASLSGDESRIITDIEDKGIVSGQAVHRNEFGINGGIFWSPKSNHIAFYQMDETMVTDYPIVNIDPTPAAVESIKYPMAGQKSHHVKVGVYSLNDESTTWLNTGEPLEQYLTCVTWSPDEKYIFIAHLNRDQNHMRLVKYDAGSGEPVKTLFEEKDDEYVEPEHQLIFLPGSNDKFLWFSERDGWNHLYLYDVEGNLIKQVTSGEYVVTSFIGFDKDGNNIFITATKESPTERHFYKVSLDKGEVTKLSTGTGIHNVSANTFGNYFIDSYTSREVPRNYQIFNEDGEVVKTIFEAKNPLTEYKTSPKDIFTIKADDETDLYCSLILPVDFDSTKKYPVVVYVYGGPHAQLVTDYFPIGRYELWFQYMAQNGYVIFTLDNRGSDNRGLDFEQAPFRNLGTIEVADQMKGVEYLKTQNFVDPGRIGVFGWSYGGFMTTSLMLRTDGAFKVGVGGGAVIDWKYYEVMYTERYMDTPETNPEGFEKASLLNYVENLNGKLLLVHGTSDPVVVWQHSLQFAKKAASLNKPLDYYPYVGHQHGVGGKDALHLYTKLSNYFFDNL
ncbi:MAG: S9 family peptidase [Melioribacteraceae bacterium]|nr:S9 family peptidase [Melioribacteraceae bacterium]MCF8355497.1 S9 family peptidase [Melioribacteraceae bacterium]MCF8394922.1 S9 family peptidase [Melioribacteraceae bacterium]MCF8420436.1 S9 family peptidase [Melioribacteraceae bacterium]